MDTQVVIWAATGSRRLAASVREALEDDADAVFCSVITLWEIVTREAVGAQVRHEGLTLVTADGRLEAYSVAVLRADVR